MTESFRLVHLSDLHFNANPRSPRGSGTHLFVSRHDPRAVQAVHGQLANAAPSSIDAVVISGDVASSGDSSDLKLGRAFVDGLSQLSSVRRVLVIPGNHDRYQDNGLSFFAPGNPEFERHFPQHRAFDVNLLADISRPGGRLVLIGIDLCLNPLDPTIRFTTLQQPGCGAAYASVLGRAERLTSFVRSQGPAYVVWVCHFPPDAQRSTLQLINDVSLVRSAQAVDINLALFGHTHSNGVVNMRHANRRGMVLATTTEHALTAKKREERSFAVLDIEVDSSGSGRVDQRHYFWDERQVGFA